MQKDPFAHLELSPANHFRLHFYAAVSRLIETLSRDFGDLDAALEVFPFLAGYNRELADFGLSTAGDTASCWAALIERWEGTQPLRLPLRALAQAAHLNFPTLRALLTIGLVEEDNRFGFVFEHAHGLAAQPRPTIGLLQAGLADPSFRSGVGQHPISRLLQLGLVRVTNPEAPRSCHALRIPVSLWQAIRGEPFERATRWVHRTRPELPNLEDINLPEDLADRIRQLPRLVADGKVRSFVVRGPEHSGKRTLAGALAKAMGRDLLEIPLTLKNDDEYAQIGPLATLLGAMPLLALDLGPGETADLPHLECYDGPIAIVLGSQGGVSGTIVEQSFSFSLAVPTIDARRRQWSTLLGSADAPDHAELESISQRFRMASGNLSRAAGLARVYAALEDRNRIKTNDILLASRALNHQMLDGLAKHVTAFGSWERLAVAGHTLEELRNLESRCRHRERLPAMTGATLGSDLNAGVRALFHGPSGTGKTLAAQVLSARLQMDLYRIDLSTVVNKYIGETEKNLDRLLSRAEVLDVILLLDEGDALLTQRTSIQTANDRYANLETNYLLQRLESFEGVLIITTNALERIDHAFQRRMDVAIDFRPPDAAERWAIWQMHLPAAHAVDLSSLGELATRCVMTGGQIRNAALHATVLALDRGEPINFSHVEPAVQREYRKMGGVCPLRSKPLAVWQ